MEIIIYLLFGLCAIATMLDSITTYKGLRSNDYYETNIIASAFFKLFGLKYGLIAITLLLYAFEIHLLIFDKSNWHKAFIFFFLFILKSSAAYNNYYDKQNFIIKALLFLVPVYWNWNKIFKKAKNIIKKHD